MPAGGELLFVAFVFNTRSSSCDSRLIKKQKSSCPEEIFRCHPLSPETDAFELLSVFFLGSLPIELSLSVVNPSCCDVAAVKGG